MVIKESELRNIIGRAIMEALDPNMAKTAQNYLNHNGGYTTNQRFDGLGGSIRQMVGSRNDSNGQRDWERSANEMQGAIRAYSNEIKRLSRVYNFIIGKESVAWSDEQKAKAAQTRAFNKQWKTDNGINANSPVYQNRAEGNGIDPSKYNAQRSNARNYNNAVANKGQDWFGPSLEEGFLGNLFNKNNGNDEVEQICANYKQYKGNQEAAQKVLDRINEYKGIVSKLKAIINQGIKGGHIQNTAAMQRSQMNAARKAAQPSQYNYVAESVTVNENQLRNIISESIKSVLSAIA